MIADWARRGGAVALSYFEEVLSDGPDGLWGFDDDAANTIVLDGSGNGYDMTASVNTDVISQAGLVSPGTAFNFAGGRYAEVINAALSPGGSAITIECILDFPIHTGGNWGIYTHHGGLSTNSPWRLINLSGSLNWGVRAPGGSLTSTTYNWSPIANSIAVVTGRYDGTSVGLFVNGSPVGTPGSYSGTIQVATAVSVAAGIYSGGVPDGWGNPMDVASIQFSALSDARILARAKAGGFA